MRVTGLTRSSYPEPSESDSLVGSSDDESETSRSNEKNSIPSSRTVSTTVSNANSVELKPAEEVDESSRATIPPTDIRPFSDVPKDVIQAFRTLRRCEQNGASKHHVYKEKKKANADYKSAAGFVDKKSKKGESVEKSPEFRRLQAHRSDPSALERHLAADSRFRTLLFAPSGGVRDKTTGLYAELLPFASNDSTHFLLCFPGTGVAGNMDRQWKNNVRQAVSTAGPPKLYEQALDLASELKTELDEDNISLSVAGHSMGGGVANFIGLSLGIPSYSFNGAALGTGTISHLDNNKCLTPERIAQQQHVRLEKDLASSSTLSKRIALLPGQGGKFPQQIGRVYEASKADPGFPTQANRIERHPLGAMDNLMSAQDKLLQKREKESTPTTLPDGAGEAPQSTAAALTGNRLPTLHFPVGDSDSTSSPEREKGDH